MPYLLGVPTTKANWPPQPHGQAGPLSGRLSATYAKIGNRFKLHLVVKEEPAQRFIQRSEWSVGSGPGVRDVLPFNFFAIEVDLSWRAFESTMLPVASMHRRWPCFNC
jgi:hypothetical protein